MAFCKATWITLRNQLVLPTNFWFKITFLFRLYHWSFFIAVLVENVEILQFSHPWAMLYKNILTVIYGQEKRHPLIPIWCPLFCQCVVVSLINGRHVLNFIQNFWHWHRDRKNNVTNMHDICVGPAWGRSGSACPWGTPKKPLNLVFKCCETTMTSVGLLRAS